MKLSDAVMLGQGIVTFNPDDYLTNGCGCLLGGAFSAVTGRRTMRLWTELYPIWPWLEREFDVPKLLQTNRWKRDTAEEIVTHFAYAIQDGDATLEDAVAWIRQHEPSESAGAPSESSEPVCSEPAEIEA